MSLGPAARALVDAAKGGDEPTDDDAARVHAQLAARLAATAGAATAASAAGSAGKSAASAAAAKIATGSSLTMGAKLLLAATIASGVAVGVAHVSGAPVTSRTVASAAHPPAALATAPPVLDGAATAAPPDGATRKAQAVPAPDLATSEAQAVPAPDRATSEAPPAPAPDLATRARPTLPPAPSSSHAGTSSVTHASGPIAPERAVEETFVPDAVREEAALLRAARALLASDPAGALAKLDEHARRFPSGALTEEREAARILALCKTGREDEATAAAARFVGGHPRSPLIAGLGCNR